MRTLERIEKFTTFAGRKFLLSAFGIVAVTVLGLVIPASATTAIPTVAAIVAAFVAANAHTTIKTADKTAGTPPKDEPKNESK